MMNLDLWLASLQYQSIAKNLAKGQFVPNVKNGSDIYEYVSFWPKFGYIVDWMILQKL